MQVIHDYGGTDATINVLLDESNSREVRVGALKAIAVIVGDPNNHRAVAERCSEFVVSVRNRCGRPAQDARAAVTPPRACPVGNDIERPCHQGARAQHHEGPQDKLAQPNCEEPRGACDRLTGHTPDSHVHSRCPP